MTALSIPLVKKQFPDIILTISVYLFCLNYLVFQIEDSHQMRQELLRLYSIGLTQFRLFWFALLASNVFSIILIAQSSRKELLKGIYITLFALNVLWIGWALM